MQIFLVKDPARKQIHVGHFFNPKTAITKAVFVINICVSWHNYEQSIAFANLAIK
jgi:hypothetical protein